MFPSPQGYEQHESKEDLCFPYMIFHSMKHNSVSDHLPFKVSGLFLIFSYYE